MLYQIQGTNVRIMGTMHIVSVGQEKWQVAMRRAFESAEVHYVETHQAKAQGVFATPSHLSPTQLPADVLAVISKYWETTSLPALDRCNLLGAWLAAGQMGLRFSLGVEALLAEWYGEQSMRELEGASDFLGSFSEVPLADYVATLRKRIPNSLQAQKNLDTTYNAWRRHDVKKLSEMTKRDTTPAIHNAMYKRRNQAWAPKIAEEAATGSSVMVFCGAGHLCGKDSLLEILERDHGLSSRRLEM
ncbi:TraB/GumN family protein [Variovorax sp. YR752]|uniref:TraB/GumN family protein n=1 Tax=Variovorax sp. YR752 TaxID=1884383 RepID=UPI003137C845